MITNCLFYVIYIELGDTYTAFIDILCEKILEFRGREKHIGNIACEVNKKMSEVDSGVIPEVSSTMTKLLYFDGKKGEIIACALFFYALSPVPLLYSALLYFTLPTISYLYLSTYFCACLMML